MSDESTRAAFPSLENDLDAGAEQTSKRVLIVTQDILGPIKNGGVGTAYYYLACDLASQGHAVSILFSLGRYSADSGIDRWVAWYAEKNIEFIPCPEPAVGPMASLMGEACRLQYRVYEYLKQRDGDFDIVHASEWGANLYYCLVAKQLGLFFLDTHFVIKASSPLLWSKLGNRQPIDAIDELPRIFMERRSVEMADTVICGSRYMLEWMRDNGYRMPEGRCFVQPNVFPLVAQQKPGEEPASPIGELIFFGRLEPRKGLAVYLDGLRMLRSRIGEEAFSRLKLTFLGKKRDDYDAAGAIARGIGKLSDRITILDQYGQPEALEYLSSSRGRLAVMPSLIDNSPFGVYELLAHRIPFVTSNRGGGKELIDSAEWDRVIFDPDPVAIGDCLERALSGDNRPVRPSFDFAASLETWRRWHRQPLAGRAIRAPLDPGQPNPLVTICLVTCNRSAELSQAIESIEAIDYRPFELILVDDASDDDAARRYLDELEQTRFDFPFRLIRQPKKYLGAARNRAAREADGEYLLVMDDDNLAKPEELDRLVSAARYSGADILTCFSDMFMDADPQRKPPRNNRILFAGADLATGLFRNPYGDSNCLIKKSAYRALGGFSEEFKVGRDDQEMFSRALLRGYRLQVVPEALYWYRVGKSRMRGHHYSSFAGYQQVSDTYISELGLGPETANILRFAQSLAADEMSITRLLVRKLVRLNFLRRSLYRMPRLLRLLRPLLRKLL